MQRITILLLALLMTVATQAQADDLRSATVPVAYFSMPFGGGSAKQEGPTFGLKLQQTEFSANQGVNLFDNKRPAFFDMQFGADGMTELNINGVNTLQQVTRYNADGEAETSSEVNWYLVGGAVIIGGYLIHKAQDDDDDDSSGGGAGGSGGF